MYTVVEEYYYLTILNEFLRYLCIENISFVLFNECNNFFSIHIFFFFLEFIGTVLYYIKNVSNIYF